MVLFHLKIINDLYVKIITTAYSFIFDTISYFKISMHETHGQIAKKQFQIFFVKLKKNKDTCLNCT